jgi:hypothetical protein
MDLSKVEFKTENDIKSFLLSNFWINLNKKDGFREFNDVYVSCIDFYEKRYLRSVPRSMKNLTFWSILDIKKFIAWTWQWVTGVYKCDIAKVFFSYARVINEKKYNQIDPIHEQLTDRLLRSIQVDSIDKNWVIKWDFRGASSQVKCFSRPKSVDSIVGKEIADVKYNSIHQFKDLHWFTFECKNKTDLLLLFQQFYNTWIFTEWFIENKNLISEEDVEGVESLDSWFKSEILAAIEKSKKTEVNKAQSKWTSGHYKEIKIKGYTNYTDPNDPSSRDNNTWIEIKFTLEWNENEKWTSLQSVFDYKKRLRELTRISWMVRQKDIINFVNDFYKNLDNNLSYKWIERISYIEELYKDLESLEDKKGEKLISEPFDISEKEIENHLLLWLYRYFCDDLIAVKRTKKSNWIYYVHKNYFKLADAWINSDLEIVDK